MNGMKMSRGILVASALALLGSLTWGSPVEAAKENFDRSKPHLAVSTKAEGVDLSGFQQLEGFGIEVAVVEYQDPSDPVVRKRPGRVKYGDITLKRGYTGATDVQDWASEAVGGAVQRRDVTIVILEPSASPVRTFVLLDCFPSSWTLETDEDGHLVEKITLAVERVELVE